MAFSLQGGPVSIQGSSPSLQGSSPQLQSSNVASFQLQPARGIPLYTGGGTVIQSGGGGGGGGGGGTVYVNSGGGGGGGGGTVASAPAVPAGPTPDELASLQQGLANIISGVSQTGAQEASQLQLYALPSLNNFEQQQTGLNVQQQQNQLNNMLSMQQIQQQLRNGLNSGAVKLAAMGGTSSSASEEMARLLSQQAASQGEQVTEQTGSTTSQLGQEQQSLQDEEGQAQQAWQGVRDTNIAYIQGWVQNQLAALNKEAAQYGASAPNPQQVNAVLNTAVSSLQNLDGSLNSQLGGVQGKAMNPQQAYQDVYGVVQNGGNYPVTPTVSNFSSTPITLQGNPLSGGAPISNLPLFLNSSGNKIQ